ncbi:MAG: hypothetical protein WBD36_14615 [Bacteroidota bacterium]
MSNESLKSVLQRRALDLAVWFIVVVCLAMMGLEVLARFTVHTILDDAYMFVRYADHVLQNGTIAWNPGGPPTYGLTSPLYLLVIIPVRLLTPTNPAMTVMLSSLISGMFFLGLTGFLLHRMLRTYRLFEKLGFVVLAVVLTLGIGRLAPHFSSGMDTMFVLSCFTFYIILVLESQDSTGFATSVAAGIVGGGLYFARPDLMIFSTLVPFSVFLFARERIRRRAGLMMLGVTLFVLVLELALAFNYFGSPVALPFFAKGLKMYGENIYRNFRGVAVREFVVYVLTWWILFVGIGYEFGVRISGRRMVRPLEIALFTGLVLFISYYLFFVWQIMHYYQRFYLPTLPALIELSIYVLLERLRVSEWRAGIEERLLRLGPRAIFVSASLIVGLLTPSVLLNTTTRISTELTDGEFLKTDIWDGYWARNWYRLDAFSKLPDEIVIATTEVGHPGVLNPDKTVIDIAGLNDTEIALHGFNSRRLFETYHPDLVYFPHRHYQEMIREIEENPYFREHYDYYPAPALGVRLGVALLRESKHYESMKQIMESPSGRE